MMTTFERKWLVDNRKRGKLPMLVAVFPELIENFGFTRKEAVYFSNNLNNVRMLYYKETFSKKERDSASAKMKGIFKRGFDPATAKRLWVRIPEYWQNKASARPKASVPGGAPEKTKKE
jgi:hypothetical protein